MDRLRGFDPDEELASDDLGYVSYDDEVDDAIDAPPLLSGDERRMQVRAYNFWAGLLGERNFPSIEDLDTEAAHDFSEHAVLLDFTEGLDNPAIAWCGAAISRECGIEEPIERIDQVPARSLLSRITDHYLQIIANRAPVGFEAEFVNARQATIMYRGILLPFSSDDDTIDFIYGVINWKEALPAGEAELLQLELRHALSASAPLVARSEPVPAFADGPTRSAGIASLTVAHEDVEGDEEELDESCGLADWLDAARRSAALASEVEGRSRAALYRAIGRAYDFALVARRNPDDFAELIADAGLTIQARAPMTPIVKLVFGAGYDKTRLTEFATALDHGLSAGVPMHGLAAHIEGFEGGLKAIVQLERTRRRGQGRPRRSAVEDPRERLRKAPPRELSDFAGSDAEFLVLVARRDAEGRLAIIGALGDEQLTERVLNRTA